MAVRPSLTPWPWSFSPFLPFTHHCLLRHPSKSEADSFTIHFHYKSCQWLTNQEGERAGSDLVPPPNILTTREIALQRSTLCLHVSAQWSSAFNWMNKKKNTFLTERKNYRSKWPISVVFHYIWSLKRILLFQLWIFKAKVILLLTMTVFVSKLLLTNWRTVPKTTGYMSMK